MVLFFCADTIDPLQTVNQKGIQKQLYNPVLGDILLIKVVHLNQLLSSLSSLNTLPVCIQSTDESFLLNTAK